VGGEEAEWLRPGPGRTGPAQAFEELVGNLVAELPVMAAASCRQLTRAVEVICGRLDRWSRQPESRAARALLRVRTGEVMFNRCESSN
jgi:hypothetical protein